MQTTKITILTFSVFILSLTSALSATYKIIYEAEIRSGLVSLQKVESGGSNSRYCIFVGKVEETKKELLKQVISDNLEGYFYSKKDNGGWECFSFEEGKEPYKEDAPMDSLPFSKTVKKYGRFINSIYIYPQVEVGGIVWLEKMTDSKNVSNITYEIINEFN